MAEAARDHPDIPLNEYCIHEPLDTVNPATHRGPLVAMALQDVIPPVRVIGDHVIPLAEYASILVADLPPATQIDPFQATVEH
jgi:hypothetical protein